MKVNRHLKTVTHQQRKWLVSSRCEPNRHGSGEVPHSVSEHRDWAGSHPCMLDDSRTFAPRLRDGTYPSCASYVEQGKPIRSPRNIEATRPQGKAMGEWVADCGKSEGRWGESPGENITRRIAVDTTPAMVKAHYRTRKGSRLSRGLLSRDSS